MMHYLKSVFHHFSFKDFCDLLVGVGTILIGLMGYRLSRKEYVPLIKAREIINDRHLYTQIQRELPKFAHSLLMRLRTQDLKIDRER